MKRVTQSYCYGIEIYTNGRFRTAHKEPSQIVDWLFSFLLVVSGVLIAGAFL